MKTKRKFLTYKSKTGKLHSVEMFAEKSLCGIPEERLELYSLMSWDATCIKCNKNLLRIDGNLLEPPAYPVDWIEPYKDKLKKWEKEQNEN